MKVFILTLYDPVACFGYTEVFYTLAGAQRYAGLQPCAWRKRGEVWLRSKTHEEVKVSKQGDCFKWTIDSEVYKIRQKRVRGRPA